MGLRPPSCSRSDLAVKASPVEVRPSPDLPCFMRLDHSSLLVVGELLHRPLTGGDLAVALGEHLRRVLLSGHVLEALSQDGPGLFEVLPLAAAVLDHHGRMGRSMDEPDGRVGLVPVLAPFAVPAVGEDLDVLVCDHDRGWELWVRTTTVAVEV